MPASDPFTALAVHFGMLLGVDDLETVVGHAWAKMRLHNAWLHGAGVVWGGGVSVDGLSREIRVEPFLALDELGRELTVPIQSCVDTKAWFDANSASVTNRGTGGQVIFDVLVVARYRACLSRPVPALVSPCDGASAQTAYSRISETAELFLIPANAAVVPDRVDRYPRLRYLRGLPNSLDAAGRDALDEAARAATDPQARLNLIRAAAMRDVVDRHPSVDPADDPRYDGSEPAYVVLAKLVGVTLSATDPVSASVQEIQPGPRVSHVDTATLFELATAAPIDAGGPRVRRATAARAGDTITVEVIGPVREPTLAGAIVVHRLDPTSGWTPVGLGTPTFTDPVLSIPLTGGPPADAVLRVVIAGTGPTPVVGDVAGRPVPLAGVVGGPPGDTESGQDAVFTIGGA